MQRRSMLLSLCLLVSTACSHSTGVTPSSPSSSAPATTTAAPSTLTGQIVDQTTKAPVPRAAVTVVDPAGTNPTLSTVADGAGTFSFANVAAGTYAMQVIAAGYPTTNATISVPVGALTIQLLKGGVQPVLPLSVAITAPATIRLGQSAQLSATVIYTDGTKSDVTNVAKWTTSTTGAGVTTSGVLTGFSAGDLVVSAAALGVSGSVPLTVLAR
ncbi:MAG TPA: carboxypeptidase regulatory-like domain-containing protein [Vicinamibacterales bacterium]|nr:carboxypeptidase regulatory-like domain-containing protein [Vicinamibacterales bacterium]